MFDQDPPHDAGRDAQEVGTVSPIHIRCDQPEVGLVYERRGLQGVSRLFASKLPASEPAELGIDEGNQASVGLLVAGAPVLEQLHDRFRVHSGALLSGGASRPAPAV
jgi:hypothetical protein